MRNLEKDLDICEAATPGPWFAKSKKASINDIDKPYLEEIWNHSFLFVAENVRSRDAKFIIEARTGWPETIRRAMEAEKRVMELENEVQRLHEDRNLEKQLRKDAEDRCAKLEVEVERLKTQRREDMELMEESIEAAKVGIKAIKLKAERDQTVSRCAALTEALIYARSIIEAHYDRGNDDYGNDEICKALELIDNCLDDE